jgi:small-conductance mechanosensitive channel
LVEYLGQFLELMRTPVLGGIYPLKAALALTMFYGSLMLAKRARVWIDAQETERPPDQTIKIRRWVQRSIVALGCVVAFGIAGLPVQAILDRRLTTLGDTELTLTTLLTASVIIWLGWWFSQLVQEAVRGSFRRRGVTEEGTLHAVNRLVHYAIMAMGLGVALQTVGVNLSALFAAGAIFAVGLGFALQDITQNFVSGLILLVERTITKRDVLELENRVVVVEDIGMRSTIVRTRDDEELIVPNGILVQSTVKNFTLSDPLTRVRTTVGVHYDSDMDQVAQVLRAAAQQVPEQASGKIPEVYLLEFADSSVRWEVSVWTLRPWKIPKARSDLNRAIWRNLKQAGIVIAYPQLDVHLMNQENP